MCEYLGHIRHVKPLQRVELSVKLLELQSSFFRKCDISNDDWHVEATADNDVEASMLRGESFEHDYV